MKCTKCGKDIPIGAGYYNYPSGLMCSTCGKERLPAVEKAMNDEIIRMAKELKNNRTLKSN